MGLRKDSPKPRCQAELALVAVPDIDGKLFDARTTIVEERSAHFGGISLLVDSATG